MDVENRYDALIERHCRLETKIAAELRRPLPDPLLLQRLKREKLLLKDEIDSWERLMSAIRMRPVFRAGAPHA